jgi:hypothetical protein
MSEDPPDELLFGLRLANAANTQNKKATTSVAEEDLKHMLKRIGESSSCEELQDLMFDPPPRSDGIRNYVKEQLSMISNDLRNHREVCADLTFDLRRCLPRPWSLALQAYAEANGLRTEALAWCFYANLSFLEHPSRRIGHRSGHPRTEAVNIPVLIGGPASSRKSFLVTATTNMMSECEDAPSDAFGNRECILADATLAGLRTSLYNHNRAAVVCDEATNVYDTPWSDVSSGLHYLPKTKMHKYLLSEPHDQLTRALGCEESRYLFHHKAPGYSVEIKKTISKLIKYNIYV